MNESIKLSNEEVQQVQEQISNYLEDSGVSEHSTLVQSTRLTAPWLNVKFNYVISSVTNGIGGKQTKDGIGIPVTRIETIANQTIDFDKVGFIADYDISKIDRYLLNQGDILFSHINSPLHLGKTAIFRENKPLYHGINLLRIVTKANVMSPYYFNYHCKLLRSQSEFSMQAQHAVNQSSLNQKKLGEFEIPLPPLAEQQQIAAKLDELLAQVYNLKTRLDNIPKILKHFRQSVLAAAVSGKLTDDWRKDNQINEWCFTQLSDLNIDIQIGPFGTLLHKSDYVEGGIPLVNPMHINDGKIIPSTFMTVASVKAAELQRYNLQIGDIVLGRRGEMGRAAVVNIDGLICGTGSLYLRPNLSEFEPIFIWLVLSASETIKYLEDNSVGTTMVNLNQKILKALPFPDVEKKEQTEIVTRVEQLFAYADQIEQRVKDAQSRVNQLTQAILAKAFRGELTADWRTQNPELISGENSAEALLARIKAEREQTQVVKKAKATPSN